MLSMQRYSTNFSQIENVLDNTIQLHNHTLKCIDTSSGIIINEKGESKKKTLNYLYSQQCLQCLMSDLLALSDINKLNTVYALIVLLSLAFQY